jgi:nucleotide-binding universal stress UspA family protein
VGGSLTVVGAYSRRSAEESPDVAADIAQRSTERLERWGAAHGLAAVPLRAMELAPDEALTRAALDSDADLVIIGSEDTEGVTELGLGSLAHRLAHHLTCPLVVVPPGETTVAGGPIVVGVDASAGSELALRWASRVGAATGGRVVAVSTIDPPRATTGPARPAGADPTVPTPGVDVGGAAVEVVERCGWDPAATLRDVAAELDAALIVVSAKLHHSLAGLLLGAVADGLLHRPTRPVAVLPHGFRERTQPHGAR